MARDISLIIGGKARAAEDALRDLQRTGSNVAHALEQDFDALGTQSAQVFDAKRDAAQKAYGRIKSSSLSTADDIAAAEKGLAQRLKSIDEQQYGKRLTMAEKFRKNWAGIAAASGVAFGAVQIGRKAIDQAREFETALVDLGKVGVEDLGAVREEIMAMPDELGDATQLVKGYYQTISAGVTEPRRAMELLTTAAQTAKAAHIQQETVIKGLTKVMKGYGGAVESASSAADLLFGIEKLGQTSVAELVPVIGDLSAISAQLSVDQYEMGAALSQVTQTAGSTSQAATQYRALLINLLKPQKTMTEALEDMGFSSGRAAIEALGLSGTLTELHKWSVESGEGMGKLFESSEALTMLGPLLSSEFAGYNEALKELKGNTGAADDAFADWQGTLEATEALFENTVGKVMIELGEELAPTVNDALRGTAEWIRDNKSDIIAFVQGLGEVVAGVAKAAEVAIDIVQGATDIYAQWTLDMDAAAQKGHTPETFFSGLFGSSDDSSGDGSQSGDDWQSNVFGSSYAVGTRHVPRTGYYQLHRGEEVKTRTEVSRERRPDPSVTIQGGLNVTLPNVTNDSTARDLARQLYPELQRLGLNYRTA